MPRKAATAAADEMPADVAQFQLTEIPRRRNSNGSEGGPYVLHPGAKRTYGSKRCETCGRMSEPDRRHPRKGKCRCMYYQRTTTFIDVLQDEYLLKQWGNRNVAYGMGQRRDLQLAAATCKPDSDPNQPAEDKTELNKIAAEAQKVAGDKSKASIGTSLHKLTEMMDRGETLGYVPEEWTDDIKAYEQATKDIEWVTIESFRVLDDWVDKSCNHTNARAKAYDPENPCNCKGVAGTVDRIGWYRGRFVITDLKTGSIFDELGKAMQLAMYARMVPYDIRTDTRGTDPHPVDPNIGYIIHLPEGQGRCDIKPIHIGKGWGAVQVAKQVWRLRKELYFMDEAQITGGRTRQDMAKVAGSVQECKMIWLSAKESNCLTGDLQKIIKARVVELGGVLK